MTIRTGLDWINRLKSLRGFSDRLVEMRSPAQCLCRAQRPYFFRNTNDSQMVHRKHIPKSLFVASLVILIGLLFVSHELADVIFLKNGNSLATERTWQDDKKIYYEKGGNVYSFSRDLVARVEASTDIVLEQIDQASPVVSLRSIPVEVLEKTIEIGSSLGSSTRSGVIQDGILNQKLLDTLELQARKNTRNREIQTRYRNALVEVINWHWNRNEWNAAEKRLDEYLQSEPGNFEASLLKASASVKKGEYKQAEAILLQIEVNHGNSADLNYLLGMTYYMQDKNEIAFRYLKKSLQLKYRPDVDQLLRKIEGENRAENEYRQSNSLHFMLRYEGTETNRLLGQDILNSLEQSYQELEGVLNFSPKESIIVVLYPDEIFQDVTQSPIWVGALNDGKIRFPIKGLSRVDQSVKKILKHELTHSFIRAKAGGNCPLWLNEGFAQYLSGESGRLFRPIAKQALLQQKLPPLSQLQGPFLGLPAYKVSWAYQQSLLATEYLIATYGVSEIQDLLLQAGVTGNFETALLLVLRRSYQEIEKEFQQYVQIAN